MKIFLIGLPGSGKTTLGKKLALLVKEKFVDLDNEIELREGKKITEIFRENGEPYFRSLEAKLLKDWCDAQEGFVLSTGGGAPCYGDNMDHINKAGISIFLDVLIPTITDRIRKDGFFERPLLASLPIEELNTKIALLRETRLPFYQRAHYSFSGDSLTAEGVATLIRNR